MELHRVWNAWKHDGAPWWREVSKCAPQEALRDLDTAIHNFFEGRRGNRGGRSVGFPRRRKKGRDDRFRLTGRIRVLEDQSLQLPRLGKVRTKESLAKLSRRLDSRICRVTSATLKREADRWFVSLAVEEEIPDPAASAGGLVGIDLGARTFAVCSDGTSYSLPQGIADQATERKLRRLSRSIGRKKKGSANRRKAVMRYARAHRRVRNRRSDFFHKTSTRLVRTKSAIVVEDLHIEGMLKNPRLAPTVAGASWQSFVRMLDYKCDWNGVEFLVADRWFASSQMCSNCSRKGPKLRPRERVFACPRADTEWTVI